MRYINVEKDLWVEVDEKKRVSRVFDRKELEAELVQTEARLGEIPPTPSDKELLAWAKANYPMMDYGAEKASLLARKDEIDRKLEKSK
jgi:hypothetical protein